eukprot:7362131-Pyramimonas_sp.AAC.1
MCGVRVGVCLEAEIKWRPDGNSTPPIRNSMQSLREISVPDAAKVFKELARPETAAHSTTITDVVVSIPPTDTTS